MQDPDGIDETSYSLVEHLTELRYRVILALLGVISTTALALFVSPALLDYAIAPLSNVLQESARIEVLVGAPVNAESEKLRKDLEDRPELRFVDQTHTLAATRKQLLAKSGSGRPIDLLLLDTRLFPSDLALLDTLIEDVEPSPLLVLMLPSADDPRFRAFQLEAAQVVLNPPSSEVQKRLIRQAAAYSGKSLGSADKLVVLSPLDPFFAYVQIALVVGLFLSCPIWLYQVWAFVAPGLYGREKRMVLPVVFSASLLFIAGGLFAYYAMFPLMFDVLVNQMMPASLAGSFTVDKYLGLMLRMTLAFGVVFELPLILAALSALGIVSAERLSSFRRYWIVAAFVIGAALTPADPLSQIMMAIPLILFYEVGIVLARMMRKRVEANQAAEDAEDPSEAA